ncbi:cytochrome c-type biogenesis protein [Marinobacter sp. SS21]|uniref:cytochrome c-type biogenesis protein n=1 Tax=Marinobacter sp. SS21 TaxID=2979460 RepID=UPI00232BAD97|nr:cytochrome c-type biogenesis protein [Marinobacter sp. SS21]MDC0662128.1 cytochrome c-type biogenesis protein CcmH [Marinobacter sp. SS21]
MGRILFAVWVLLLPLAASATSEVYPFDTAADQERFRTLISELRCPKCQNQNIADSNAPIAKDMRDEVYRMLRQGATNQQVTDALVGRFGEFVLYKPGFDERTALLWATPLIAVLGGVLVVIGIVIRGRRRDPSESSLSDAERRRAEQLLEDRDDGA